MIDEEIIEEKDAFEKWRNTVGLVFGPLLALILYLIPMPSLNDKAHILLSIVSWVVIWWITEPIPIPITAIMGAILCVICKVADVKSAFLSFADPTIFLFLGSFILAEAMIVHGLDKRIAFSIISLPWVGNSSGRILFIFGLITAFLSMWISNTASTAMMFPIGLGIIYTMANMIQEQTGRKVDFQKLKYGTGIMLMASYASSAGGIGTPVGTPPNIMGIAMLDKLAGIKIPFFKWMAFAVPLLVVMYFGLYLMIYLLHKPEVAVISGGQSYLKKERERLGKWNRGQINVLIAFLLAITLWIIPGFLAVIYGSDSPVSKTYSERIPESVAVLIAITLLFLLPVDWKRRQFTLSFKQALRIDWGTLLLFGGGLTLGDQMFKTELADVIGRKLLEVSGVESLWGLTLAAIFISILVSETTSNTASAAMVVPVIISICQAAGVNPLPPALGGILGASWGFMLPVSTPPNAIIYGSGLVPITKMIRAGVIFDLMGGVIIWVGLRIMLPLVKLI